MKLLFATGGSGGHIYPALATAQEAEKRGYTAFFIGQTDGMEERILPAAGYPFYGVPAGKWDRQRPNPLQGVRAAGGLVTAVSLLRQLRPQLVLGFGGFASFPGLAAARLLGVPYVLHEGNAYPGKVTRWFAAGARRVAISHEAARAHLEGARTVLTGFPIREERVAKAEARERLKLPQGGLLTFVMGGSQGSKVLNEAVPKAYADLCAAPTAGAGPHAVLHSTGRRWAGEVAAVTESFKSYFTSGFVDATLAWSAADVAITRSGVSTLSEAAYHGVPSIMVPLPSAAENHQLRNAEAVTAAGAGWTLEETDLEQLALLWRRALEMGERERAAAAARDLSPAGAAATIVTLIDEVLSASQESA